MPKPHYTTEHSYSEPPQGTRYGRIPVFRPGHPTQCVGWAFCDPEVFPLLSQLHWIASNGAWRQWPVFSFPAMTRVVWTPPAGPGLAPSSAGQLFYTDVIIGRLVVALFQFNQAQWDELMTTQGFFAVQEVLDNLPRLRYWNGNYLDVRMTNIRTKLTPQALAYRKAHGFVPPRPALAPTSPPFASQALAPEQPGPEQLPQQHTYDIVAELDRIYSTSASPLATPQANPPPVSPPPVSESETGDPPLSSPPKDLSDLFQPPEGQGIVEIKEEGGGCHG